jgi:hypothetical protein
MESDFIQSYKYIKDLKSRAVAGKHYEFASDLRELERASFGLEFTYDMESEFDIGVFNIKILEIFQKHSHIPIVIQIVRDYKINLLIQ